ncbi:MAG: protein kinase, partial [Blastocatellia bacterium]|nr:protein kinase [Blastocatellia bacterium]
LNRYDRNSETFSALRHDPNNSNSISSDNLRGICEDQKGTIWIGTKDEGLTLYDRKTQTFTRLRHNPNDPSTISSNFIREIYQDSQGILWVGTDNGLNKYNYETNSFTVFRNLPNISNSISNNDIRVIYEDRSNTLWIGTRNGLNRYNRNDSTFTVFQPNSSDSSSIRGDVIFSIYEDHTGILWVGTNGGGVNKYDPRVQRFTTIKSSPVYSIYQDSQGSIWVGTDGRGLNKYNSQGELLATFRHNPKNANSISSDVVHSVYEDPSGIFWIATLDGLNRYDPKKQTFTTFRHDPKDSNTISNNIVQIICSDSDNILWIGTERGGLNRYDSRKQTFKAFRKNSNPDPNSLKGDNVRAIAIDDNNKMIWIGTDEGGLSRFDPKTETFTTFLHDPNNPNSITSNFVFSICIDSKGILWIGTNAGLNRFDPKTETFKNFAELSNETIYGVLDDGQVELWLSSNRGIYRFNSETETLKNYDVSDGLQSNEFNGFAYYKSCQGEMFFGGINGFNRFFPEKIKDNNFVPSIVITKFKIFDRVTNRFLLASGLGETQPLTLSYKENFFSFEFAALNFTNSQKNQYMYKLEGIDSDWVKNGTQRYAQYTSLPPGEYIFRVKGSNNDGLWNEQGIALKITITPPVWRTWWAYSLYFLTFVGLSYRAYRYRLETLERRLQLERAEEVGKKNQELEAKNQELAAQKEKLVEKNKELIESHQRADRIFSALAEALPGTVLDSKYRLEEKIGTGGFGAVFSATHLSMKRQVAVKVFKPVAGNDSADALNRFQMEAVSASRINSPNAVAILDSGISTEGIAYLVMELLQGHTLNRELQLRKRVSLKRAAQILLPICSVLSKAHSLGIVHRDIKPDNIFLHRDGEGEVVKLVDFGIAKLTENMDISSFQNLTATGVIIGTPAYMAPERFEGGAYDTSSDVYSLGLVLYEMLAGCSPFQGSFKDIFGLLHAHLSFPPRPIREFNTEISPEVEAVVMRAIAKNPSERPSVEVLAESFLQATGLNIEQLNIHESQTVVTGDLHYSSSPNSTTMTDLQLVVR